MAKSNMTQIRVRLSLAAPRGFCAGVDRAIEIVRTAISHYGPPVYVRHEVVHNRSVVEQLRSDGAVFVDELFDIGVVLIITEDQNKFFPDRVSKINLKNKDTLLLFLRDNEKKLFLDNCKPILKI